MAIPNIYQIGDAVTISGVFRDTTNALYDPPTARFYYRTPAGATAVRDYPGNALVTRSAAGLYYTQVYVPTGSASAAGVWTYRVEGVSAGTAAGAAESYWKVERSRIWTA